MAQNQVIDLENLITKLQKNLQDIYIIEKEIIRLDQLLIAGKNTGLKFKEKLQNLNIYLQNLKTQKENLQEIRAEAIRNGFGDLSRKRFTELQKIWQTQNPEALAEILKNLNKLSHLSNHLYMFKEHILKVIGRDSSGVYHFADINIPANISLEKPSGS